jgi:ribosome-associated protein
VNKASETTAEEIARIALGCIEDKKASATVVLKVSALTILADYFIITTVENRRQAHAIVAEIRTELKRKRILAVSVEEAGEAQWTLLDFGPVVIHIFQPDARAYFDLDSYWGDAPAVTLEPIAPTGAPEAAETEDAA